MLWNNFKGKEFHGRRKRSGSFSCPKLAANANSQPVTPVTVSNGQLDVYFQFLPS